MKAKHFLYTMWVSWGFLGLACVGGGVSMATPTAKPFRLKRQEKELLNKPYYKELLQTLVFSAANGEKRHAGMLSYDLQDLDIVLTRNQVAARLGGLVRAGLAEPFQDWVDGNHIGNNYDPTVRGVEVAANVCDMDEEVLRLARIQAADSIKICG